MGEKKIASWILVGKPEGKNPFESNGRRREDDI
jgi:hypothetical protein